MQQQEERWHKTLERLNRAYLYTVQELTKVLGEEVASKVFGMSLDSARLLKDLDPYDIDVLASSGAAMIRLDIDVAEAINQKRSSDIDLLIISRNLQKRLACK